jgi:hypothetical protein
MKTDIIVEWRFQLLLVVSLCLIAVSPFLESRWFFDIVSTALLLFAISSVIGKRMHMVIYGALSVAAVVGIWVANWFPNAATALAVHFMGMVFLILIVAAIMAHLFRSARITRETIAGAICAYLLIGMVWGHAFAILDYLVPGSFADTSIETEASVDPEPIRDQIAQFNYFSFVTLTTLGYGDMTPLSRPAKNLAALEAILGQLYIAVLIARLVGLMQPAKPRQN